MNEPHEVEAFTDKDIHTLGDVLSPEEVKKFLKYTERLALKGGKYLRQAILIRLYAITGRRKNEILQLTCGDIDLNNSLIKTHIQKKKKAEHSKFVSIDSKTRDMLEVYMKQNCNRLNSKKRLFDVSVRYPLRAIEKAAKELGINKRVTTHSFRYSLITALKVKGFTNEAIAKITGQHPMTVGRYDMSTFFDIKSDFETARSELFGLDDEADNDK